MKEKSTEMIFKNNKLLYSLDKINDELKCLIRNQENLILSLQNKIKELTEYNISIPTDKLGLNQEEFKLLALKINEERKKENKKE